MTRDTAENMMYAADEHDAMQSLLAELAEDDAVDSFMDMVAELDRIFAKVDPISQTALDFCTGIEALTNIRMEYDIA